MSTVTWDQEPRAWPVHVARALHLDQEIDSQTRRGWQHCIHTANPAQGNGMISRLVLNHLHGLMKTTPGENILVGIIWSGTTRTEIYQDRDSINDSGNFYSVANQHDGGWALLNAHWSDPKSKLWYRHFYHEINSLVASYEHILRVQWFLQQHHVKYFMGTITQEVFPKQSLNHDEIKYLHDMIDFSHFLPIEFGIYEWARDHSGLDFDAHDRCHLNTQQSKLLSEQIIMPFLEKLDYV